MLPKAAENKQPADFIQPVLTSQVKHKNKTILQNQNKPSGPAKYI